MSQNNFTESAYIKSSKEYRDFIANKQVHRTDGLSHAYGADGRFDKRVIFEDGTIVEIFVYAFGFTGMFKSAYVWANEDDWNKHNHFPRNIKNEVGLGGKV